MLIGREKEQQILLNAVQKDESRFVAVYGRRRVGKTYLIRETFAYRFTFQHTGVANGTLEDELFAFSDSLKRAGLKNFRSPKNWLEAFSLLKDTIELSNDEKKIIFIDELSWMDTKKSKLIMALENFWNGWASARKDIVLIVCTSATSWMVNNIIHNTGGLYNRLTDQIHLHPFSLAQCEKLIQSKKIIMSRQEILQCYMIMGGIPFYWNYLEKGLSLPQNIDSIFFAENAPLKNEFQYLYSSIFKNAEIHIDIITALSKKKAGMTRGEIADALKKSSSGILTKKLEELEASGFIRKYKSYGSKKNNSIYQLTDCFTLFYFQFMENNPSDEHFWSNQISTPKINTWSGLAFERVCLLHVNQMKVKLGISGVLTETYSWRCKKDVDKDIYGSQIDLLIVRKDQVINLCEMKYSQLEYTMNEQAQRDIMERIHDFQQVTKCNYSIHPTLVTTKGLNQNIYSGCIQAVITADDLFAF